MLAPYRHVATPGELDAGERTEIWELLDHSLGVLARTIKPHGHNVGMNLGRVAGAGVEGHLHVHVVPRWNGDTLAAHPDVDGARCSAPATSR